MSVAAHALLTYEQYLAEEVTSQRYHIVDGVRIVMNPTRRHQDILLNIAESLRVYQRATRTGKVIVAPCDVLIRRHPLRVRQPDVLFISSARLARSGSNTDPSPLIEAPELTVEILSPSETLPIRNAKIADYCYVGVQECWMVDPVQQSVEVLCLTAESAQSVATYGAGDSVVSLAFPDLSVPIAAIFEF